jgi:hypothetical protein
MMVVWSVGCLSPAGAGVPGPPPLGDQALPSKKAPTKPPASS